MFNKKSLVFFVSMLLVLAMLLTGCGNSASSNSQEGESSSNSKKKPNWCLQPGVEHLKRALEK